jgi:hypothetical protein
MRSLTPVGLEELLAGKSEKWPTVDDTVSYIFQEARKKEWDGLDFESSRLITPPSIATMSPASQPSGGSTDRADTTESPEDL